MKAIVLNKAAMTQIEMKPGNGGMKSRIKIVAPLGADVAKELEARWLLFDRESMPKSGYQAVELDTELINVRMKFEAEKLGKSVDMYVERVGKFKVFRKGDGKKKARRLMMSCWAHCLGSPFDLLEYMLGVGGIEGTCTLEPRQGEMFEMQVAEESEFATFYEHNGFTARIEVKEAPGGMFAMTRRANSPSAKLAQVPPVEFPSEQQAREAGAIEIQSWCDKLRVRGGDKKEAAKLSEWCAQYIGQPMLEMPTEEEPVTAGEAAN